MERLILAVYELRLIRHSPKLLCVLVKVGWKWMEMAVKC